MMSLFKGFVLTLLLLLTLGLATAQSDDAPAALDLVVALDVSGSMDYDTDRNRYPSVDNGLRVLVDQRIIEQTHTATDPDKLRFTATETIFEWLAAYSAQYASAIDINASAVTFSDAPQVIMDWQNLRRTNDGTEALLEPLPRESIFTEGDQPQNSNFVALYETLAQQFSARDSENRRVVLLVTDSVPCFPAGQRNASAPLYDRYCAEISSMGRHINALSSLNGAVEHVIFINPLGAAHWGEDTFQTVKEAWQGHLTANGGSFREIANIEALPATMMDAAMRELGVALGDIDTDTSNATERVTANQYTAMGISYADNGTFQVPPFQSYVDVLSLLPGTNANFSLTTPQKTDAEITTVYGTDSESMRIARVIQPPPGEWKANDPLPQDTPTWALFRAGEAALDVFGDTPAQYGTLRFRYTLTDHTGTPFRFTAETTPDFSFQVTPAGGGGQPIDLSAFQIDPEDNTALISPELLAFTTGNYDLSLEVTPGTGAIWRTDANYGFLQPAKAPKLNIPAVVFVADYEVVNRVTASADTSTTVNMPRSLPLTVHLKTDPEGDLPQGVIAKLLFEAPQDSSITNVCPQTTVYIDISENSSQLKSAPIRFEEAGGCELSVEVSITSPLPPLNGQTQVISTGNARAVTVTPTQRLTYQLVQSNGETPVDTDLQTTDFTLNFPNGLAFEPNQLVLRVEVRDENGRLTAPQFLEGETTPNGQNCRAPSASAPASTTEDGAESAEPLTADVSGQKVVPFSLVVTNGANADVATSNGVCLYATDRPGVYQAVLDNLLPDTYTVQVALSNDNPRLDYERFEWQPTLFSGGLSVPAQLEATVQVNINPYVVTVYGSAAAAVVVFVLLAAVLIIQRRQRTVAPLKGWPALYAVTQDEQFAYETDDSDASISGTKSPSWEIRQTGRNTYTYGAGEFKDKNLLPLGIKSLVLTTKKQKDLSKAGAFHYTYELKGDQKDHSRQPLEPGQVIELNASNRLTRFFLVNRASQAEQVSVRDLLSQQRRTRTDDNGDAS